MKMNTQQSKTYKTQQGSPEKEVHSNAGLPKKDRNIQINKLTDIYKNWSNNNKVQRE